MQILDHINTFAVKVYLCCMAFNTEIGTSIETAAVYLKEGQLIGMPTETVYGLAGNALDPEVIAKIYEVKERPLYNPLIIHVAEQDQARSLVREWPPELEKLMSLFWPGPLTLLLERSKGIPDLVTAGLPRVAIRLPDHQMARDLILACGFPLAAPSANLFTRISPTTAMHVHAQLEGRIPYILDGGPCAIGLESTILGHENGRWVIYRTGAITASDLAPFLGIVHTYQGTKTPVAPGMLPMHYAPKTKLVFGPMNAEAPEVKSGRAALLRFKSRLPSKCPQVILAADGQTRTAAKNLYAAMHELDALGKDIILAEPVPEEGIGRAINDRLRRAGSSSV